MPEPSVPAAHLSRNPGHARRFTRTAVTLGVLAGLTGGAALHAAAGHLQGLILDYAWRSAATQAGTPPAFGGGQTSGPKLRSTTVLQGVNGEVFSSPGIQASADGAVTPDMFETGPLANISPAAWNRLSAGDCITLTTKGGQKLSFRIIGAHPAGEPKAEMLPKIDLAVTACSGTGEPIAKAVIEPARQPTAQHSL